MRVLTVHNRYQQRGGEDECFEAERDLLRARGHVVEEHVVDNHGIKRRDAPLTGLRTVWSRSEYKQIRLLIRRTNPDIVHVHNFFPLISPAVYYAAQAEGVPVVQTLHNYRLVCPGALLYRQNRPCEECVGKPLPWPGVLHGCYRSSRAASAATATMVATHRLLGTWSRVVSAYIVLTELARKKFIFGGLPEQKLFLKPNFAPDAGQGSGEGGYALFVGRLTEEKGVRVLIDAWRDEHPGLPLKVVGGGPLETFVRDAAVGACQVQYLGELPRRDVYSMMRGAATLVFPSLSYETFGRTIIEAFAAGTPVVASKLGAMESLVKHRHTGLHFLPGSATDLAAQVRWLADHGAERHDMRQNARAEYLRKYTASTNYESLMNVYTRVLAGAHASNLAVSTS